MVAASIQKAVEKKAFCLQRCLCALIYSCIISLLAVYILNYVNLIGYLQKSPSISTSMVDNQYYKGEQFQEFPVVEVREESLPQEQDSAVNKNHEANKKSSVSQPGCHPVQLDPFAVHFPNITQPRAADEFKSCGEFQSRIVLKNSTIHVTMDDPHSACFFSEIFWAGDYAIVNSIKQWKSTPYTPALSDFVQANCIDYKTGYSYETAVPVPTKISARLLKLRGWPWLPEDALPVNILVVGLSRTSSNQFIRGYPKSHHELSKVLKAVHFPGYNVLGRGPMENFLPLITGVKTYPVWGNQGIFKLFTDEVYPIIFRAFERFGYVTALLDDLIGNSPSRGHERGFRRKPADHYSRPLQMIRKFVSPNGATCIDNSTSASAILGYTRKLWDLYPDHPKFFMTMVGQNSTDSDLHNFLMSFPAGTLDSSNTLLVFLSDEGYSYKEENDLQVRLEENNPTLYIRLPQGLTQYWPQAVQNAKENAKYLTTPLDLHATLKSLLSFKSQDYQQPADSSQLQWMSLGRSSFQHPSLFSSGNCQNLGIPDEFCSCHEHERMPATLASHSGLIEYANQTVAFINTLMRQEMMVFEQHMLHSKNAQYMDMCIPWKLRNVTGRASNYTGSMSTARMQFVVEVEPAQQYFEVNVDEGLFNQSVMPEPTSILSRNDVETLGCCVPKELHMLRELCYCNLEVSSIRKACEAIKSD